MSDAVASLTAKQQARYLEAARVAGLWFIHNQNAPGQGWGGVDQSADTGRFLYEYFPATGQCRGAGVWSQALAICALLALDRTNSYEGEQFGRAWKLGADYLLSLQVLDSRLEKSYGGFREHTPQTTWGSCRDGATGCFALATLAREAQLSDCRERADLYCQWYRRWGSNDAGWPHRFFRHDTGTPEPPAIAGDWQAGGALAYYYTARAAGDRRWIEDGLRPVAEQLLTIGDPSVADGDGQKWHGESRITVGNDDFATIAAMAAFVSFEDERYLDLARRRICWMLTSQDADGSFPNGGGTMVTGLTLLEFVELAGVYGLDDDTGPMVDALQRAANFALSLQEHDHRDRRAYGGLYGQSNYGVGRDRIHNRDVSYAIHLWLRLAGFAAPCLSAVAWRENARS